MEIYNIRNVAQREIYDSYMGILRISPIEDTDDITTYLEDIDNSSPIYLSDSDGNALGSGVFGGFRFVPKVRHYKEGDIILIQTKAELIYATDELNIRSTVIIGSDESDEDEARKSKLKFYFSADDVTTFNTNGVLLYPVESPNDEDYFNAKFKLGTIGDVSFDFSDLSNKGEERKEQLEENLRKLNPEQYKTLFNSGKINSSEIVTVKGQKVYYPNDNSEAIPALRTRDYVLGHCNGHSGILSTGTYERFLNQNAEYNTISPQESKITKLSYLDVDKMVWDCLEDVMDGKIRDFEGRYRELGLKKEDSIISSLFGNESESIFSNSSITKATDSELFNTAPFIIDEVEKGVIVYNAIPFRRYMFHSLRQAARNQEDLGATANTYDEKITPFKRFSNNVMNNLTKNYLLCNNKEITYDNYQNINILNNSLFETQSGSFEPVVNNKKPVFKTISSGVYGAIKNSSSNSKFKTPDIFRLCGKLEDNTLLFSPRFLRGLTWNVKEDSTFNGYDGKEKSETIKRKNGYDNAVLNLENPIQINKSGLYPNAFGSECNKTCYFRKSDGTFYSISDLEKQPAFKDYFSCNNIILNNVESYGKNFDFSINYNPHYHYSFYKSSGVVSYSESSEKAVYGYDLARPVTNYFTTDLLENTTYQQYCLKKGIDKFFEHRPLKISSKTILRNDNPASITSFYLANGKNEGKGETYTLSNLPSNDPTNTSMARKIQEFVYKLNDAEGRYPVAAYGGNAGHRLRGYYHCRVHGKFGSRHSRTNYYWRRGMSYKIHGTATRPEEYHCITSLPIDSISSLGNRTMLSIGEFKKDDKNNYVISSSDDVSPTHFNLLPLIRI